MKEFSKALGDNPQVILARRRIVDVVEELRDFGLEVDVHDPWVKPSEAKREYGIDLVEAPQTGAYAGIILAVAHDTFRDTGSAQIRSLGADKHLFFDLKNVFDASESDP